MVIGEKFASQILPRTPKWKRAEGQCEWRMFFYNTFFYRSMFGIALWTQPVWNLMQFNRTGQGSPLSWGPSKVLEGTGTSPYPGEG